MSDSLRPHGLQPIRLLRPWDFPGKSTRVRCHRLLRKMLQRLENRMEKMQDKINTVNTITEDIEEIKNKQIEMNTTITEIKNTPEGTSSRITEAEE